MNRNISLEQVSKLIIESTENELQGQLQRRSVKLLALIRRGASPKNAQQILKMSALTEREATMPDVRFAAMDWQVEPSTKVKGTLNRKKLIRKMIWESAI